MRSANSWPRTPAPTPFHSNPSPVMRRRVAPWRSVDPCETPLADGGPISVLIRRPISRYGRGIPHRAIGRVVFPAPVCVELDDTDHLPRHVRRRACALIVTITVRTPGVEAV